MSCGCGDCEEMMQPYLDGTLSDDQVKEAREHLERCPPCDRRYRFEVTLRHYVRVAASEPIPAELKAKLAGLRETAS
jgi:anti-sigma factor (TIGR02949 family)